MRRVACWLGWACVSLLMGQPVSADPLSPENLYLLLMKVGRAPREVSYTGTYVTERVYQAKSESFVLRIEHNPTGRDRVTVIEPPRLAGEAFRRDLPPPSLGDGPGPAPGPGMGLGPGHPGPGPGPRPGGPRMSVYGSRLLGDLSLLLANYSLQANEGEPVAGRATYRIDIEPKYPDRESKGIWIDKQTGIVLKVEVRMPLRGELRDSYFTDILLAPDSWDPQLGTGAPLPSTLPEPLSAALSGEAHDGWLGVADLDELSELDSLSAGAGFELLSPGYLPKGFVLNEVHQIPLPADASKSAVHLLYSDGLASISLFLQAQEPFWPDNLRRLFLGDPNAHRIEERGFMVLEGEKDGTRYVLVSDIGGDDLNKMAASLAAVSR